MYIFMYMYVCMYVCMCVCVCVFVCVCVCVYRARGVESKACLCLFCKARPASFDQLLF